MKLKIKKGDTVMVIAGNSKGTVGRVLVVDPKNQRVLVEGVNMRTKAVRPSQQYPNGGLMKREASIHYSNVQLVDSKNKPTRVRIDVSVNAEGKRVTKRIAKTTNEEV
jgi:large subunit ribosomal protein L24